MPDNNNTEDYILLIKAELDESVRTALNGFKVASDQLTAEAKQIQQSIKEVGENGGKGIEGVEQEVKRLTAATRQLGNPLNTAARGTKETKSAMDQWIASLNRAEQELREIPTRVTFLNNELKKLKLNAKENASIINLYSNELNKLQAAQLGSAAATQKSGRGMARFRQLAQNTAYQVTDFGVSIQNGTRASVAFTQQVPQVLGAFGAVGAVLGLAATGVGIFAGRWIDSLAESLDASRAFKESNKELEKSIQKFGEQANQISLDNYIEQLTLAGDAQKGLLSSFAQQDLSLIAAQTEKTMNAAAKGIRQSINDIADESRLFGTAAKDVALDFSQAFGTTYDEAIGLADALNGINVEENLQSVLTTLDSTNEKEREVIEQLKEYIRLNKNLDVVLERRNEAYEASLALRDKNFSFFIRQGKEAAKEAVAGLALQDARNKGFDDYLIKLFKEGELTKEQLDRLRKVKETTDKISKENQKLISDYQKIARSTDTAEEKRNRELEDLQKLQRELKKISEKTGVIVDPEVIEKARIKIQETFESDRIKEFRDSLSEVDRIFFDMNEKALQTAENLSQLAFVRENGTFEEYAALVKLLGDAAPLADQLKVKMIEMQDQGKEQEEINRLIAEMAEQYDLTEKEVKDLQKAMGITAKDMKKELTEMQKLLNDVAEKSIGHMTDAFIEFAKTGKTNFKDLINAILEDTARLFVSQQFRQLFTDIGLITTTDGGGASASGGEGNSSFFTKGFNYLKGLGSELFSGGTQKNVPLTNAFTSAAANTAGNVAVNVINNSSNQTTTRQSRSSDGSSVDVIIENAVDKAFANGRFDNTFSGQYGLQRRGT